jgi:protein-tyrosine phosphatase
MGLYEEHFGSQNVLHAPIPDHHLPSVELVHEHILPFLRNAKEQNEPVVVHCQAGIGRTGVVLAAWLVDEYDYDVESAIEVVKSRYRNPLDAVERDNSTFDEIENVLIGPLDEENDSE